jgi:hypothetical protein|tara:strand:- start:114 stop:638 length:525 start_codon:yes stop_codon:yes gene_type:complete
MSSSDNLIAQNILGQIPASRGILWEKIENFKNKISVIEGALTHKPGDEQSEGLKKTAPLKHHFEGGLYTREIFMPKGAVIVSLIHKQEHPSFLLKGELSYLTDDGEIVRVKAPHTVFTKKGTQRVFYIHEDVEWSCVHKTNATNVLDAELELFTNNYRELPSDVINIKKEIWQQ